MTKIGHRLVHVHLREWSHESILVYYYYTRILCHTPNGFFCIQLEVPMCVYTIPLLVCGALTDVLPQIVTAIYFVFIDIVVMTQYTYYQLKNQGLRGKVWGH